MLLYGLGIVVHFPPNWGGTTPKISPPKNFVPPQGSPPSLLVNQVPPHFVRFGGVKNLVPPPTWGGTPQILLVPPQRWGGTPQNLLVPLQNMGVPLQNREIFPTKTFGGELAKNFGGESSNVPPLLGGKFPPKFPPIFFRLTRFAGFFFSVPPQLVEKKQSPKFWDGF